MLQNWKQILSNNNNPKVKYMFRAKGIVYTEEGKTEIGWRYGNLVWVETMPNPVNIGGIKQSSDNYYIQNRKPYSSADWDLPFPVVRYLIPKDLWETIGQYQGYNDCEGTNIFEGDIVEEVYTTDEGTWIYQYIAHNFMFYDDTATSFEPKEFEEKDEKKRFNAMLGLSANTLSKLRVVGNIFDGARPMCTINFDYERFVSYLEKYGLN